MAARKYVVWFHNHTCNKDDEWAGVWAKDEAEAREKAQPKMDSHRFSMGRVYTIQEFRRFFGSDWAKLVRFSRK